MIWFVAVEVAGDSAAGFGYKPTMPSGELDRVLSGNAASHCAALFYGEWSELLEKGSADYIKGQGTMTFVTLNGRCYGITNEHVVGAKYTGPLRVDLGNRGRIAARTPVAGAPAHAPVQRKIHFSPSQRRRQW